MNEPIKVLQEISPIKIISQKNGAYIFDLGQNIAGWVQLKLPYNPGNKLIFRHGEVLNEKGELYTANLRRATQTDTFISGTQSTVDYEPRFTYHGFRYVEISGLTKAPVIENVTG
jgi:alpha-L-rhamnosidase